MDDITLSVSEFVDVFNQTMDMAYAGVTLIGELANFRISKNRWVYFDLKDSSSSIKFFGTVYQLPGPLQDGMLLKVKATPRLHNNYGFSMNVMSILPSGEGSIKKAAELLKEKLAKEGLFEPERKRLLPYPPETIGLIASKQSAAYADFIKIINARWHGISISHIDVQVQGEVAPEQIVQAIEQMNSLLSPPEILVIIRGGGSPEDLAAFSSENVTRAVAASRVPTVVAVGHEIDISLAELAADLRASTPSNAAELIVPDKTQIVEELNQKNEFIIHSVIRRLSSAMQEINGLHVTLDNQVDRIFAEVKYSIGLKKQLINAYNPQEVLKLGYAIVKTVGQAVVKSSSQLKVGDNVNVALKNGGFEAKVSKLN